MSVFSFVNYFTGWWYSIIRLLVLMLHAKQLSRVFVRYEALN